MANPTSVSNLDLINQSTAKSVPDGSCFGSSLFRKSVETIQLTTRRDRRTSAPAERLVLQINPGMQTKTKITKLATSSATASLGHHSHDPQTAEAIGLTSSAPKQSLVAALIVKNDPQATLNDKTSSELKLSSLPRCQPRNFPPKATRLGDSPRQRGQVTEMQRKLQTYQREIVRNASIASHSAVAHGKSRPDPPHLVPLASPGPITPFMLDVDRDPFAVSFTNSESPSRTPIRERVR